MSGRVKCCSNFIQEKSNKALYLDLESVGVSAATGLLELAALGHDTGLDTVVGVGVINRGSVAEVSLCLTGIAGTTQQDGVGALGCLQGKLIKGQALTTSLGDAGTGGLGESKSTDGHLGNINKANIVGDTTDNDSGLAILALHVSGDTGNGKRSPVHSGRTESLNNGSGELRLGTARQEHEELLEQLHVNVLGHGGLSGVVLDTSATCFQINTHFAVLKNNKLVFDYSQNVNSLTYLTIINKLLLLILLINSKTIGRS